MELRRSIVPGITALLLLGVAPTSGVVSGDRGTAPLVLTVALGSEINPPAAGVRFADAVRRMSKGKMAIAFRSTTPAGLTVEGERLAIREVREGSAPMAWVPTRGWDTQGVRTFTALQAPFLVTDYALLRKVLTGEIGRAMLATRNAGVRTL